MSAWESAQSERGAGADRERVLRYASSDPGAGVIHGRRKIMTSVAENPAALARVTDMKRLLEEEGIFLLPGFTRSPRLQKSN